MFMRKMLAVLSLLAPVSALASIHLTTPYVITGPNGLTTVAAPNATATGKSFDWLSQTACITYQFGTVTVSGGIDQTFTPTANTPVITNCLNLVNGKWVAEASGIGVVGSGVLTGSQLTSAITVYTGPLTVLRDNADYFASVTFLPGTQPDLWGAGDL